MAGDYAQLEWLTLTGSGRDPELGRSPGASGAAKTLTMG
jgi:hypothetical protein